ncbi:MAG: ArnT family glycosyltransferase [Nitrososphaera sp.]|uniref:ArnT family glycosyltransferase n=1 Tax=Nitrososphaera sp. TaxID=1971748 RepID=UPI003D6EB328
MSAFTHLWNPVGFPDLFYDEGVYMRRAMLVADGLGPQEGNYYDHPHFGQLFLGGVLGITGYPDALNPDNSIQSMQNLYLVPRLVMGMLSIVDTFLIFKIAEKRYGKKVAVVASILFAVMPMTWLLRRILLDSILLPFLLGSILMAVYAKDSRHAGAFALASGVLLGLAIYTKIPAFVMMSLVGYLMYASIKASKRRRARLLLYWILPAILIPMFWPAQSILAGQFDSWKEDVLWQTQRESGGLNSLARYFIQFDPVLMILGIAGIGYSIWRRDLLVALWALPFVFFLSVIGYVQYFHWIPILPAIAIAGARLIVELPSRISHSVTQNAIIFGVAGGIAIFGIVSTTLLITANVSSAQFEALSFTANYLDKDEQDAMTTTLASPVYSWVLNYALRYDNVFMDYRHALFHPIRTDHVLMMFDRHLQNDPGMEGRLGKIYNNTETIKIFNETVSGYGQDYPYSSMRVNLEGSFIDTRSSR